MIVLEGIAWSVSWFENNFILTYNEPFGEPFSNLTGTYVAKLKAVDATYNNENIYRDVLTLTINSSTIDGAVVSTTIWNESDYDGYTPEKFELKITGNGISPIIERGY